MTRSTPNRNPHFRKISANTSNSGNIRTPRSTRKGARSFVHRWNVSKKRRSIGGAEGRKRAMNRMTADMVALSTRSMFFSPNRLAALLQVRDMRMVFDWLVEAWRLGRLNFQAQAVKAKLWIFAPAEEVAILSRFVKLVAIMWWSALLCLQVVAVTQVQILRWILALSFPTLRR